MITEIISVPVEAHWAGEYRLEYDGKYWTLYGQDRNYPLYDYSKGEYSNEEFDEMVLFPCVYEGRDKFAELIEIMPNEIKIKVTDL